MVERIKKVMAQGPLLPSQPVSETTFINQPSPPISTRSIGNLAHWQRDQATGKEQKVSWRTTAYPAGDHTSSVCTGPSHGDVKAPGSSPT